MAAASALTSGLPPLPKNVEQSLENNHDKKDVEKNSSKDEPDESTSSQLQSVSLTSHNRTESANSKNFNEVSSPSTIPSEHADSRSSPDSEVAVRTAKHFEQLELIATHDHVILWLARTSAETLRPRRVTGTVEVRQAGNVIVVSRDDRVADVFKLLVIEGILSAPVLKPDGSFDGIIDMLDIIHQVLKNFRNGENSQLDASVLRSITVQSLFEQPAWPHRHSSTVLPRQCSLLFVCELIARRNIQRVPLVDSKGKICGLVSQSMIISLLSLNTDFLGHQLRRTSVRELMTLSYRHVVSIHENESVMSAFQKLIDSKIGGLAVVDDAGRLVDVISQRDIRTIGANFERLNLLNSSVKEFKATARLLFPQQTPHAPIYVTEDDTLETVLGRTAYGNIHRVLVVRHTTIKHGNEWINGPVAIAIFTLRDIIRFILFRVGLPVSHVS